MSDPARERLAAEQAELLLSLLAGGPAPRGFDGDALRVEAAALLAKRRRVAAMLSPETAAELGTRFAPLFAEYARDNPRRVGSRAREDAAAFDRWLLDGGHRAAPGAPRRWWRRTGERNTGDAGKKPWRSR